MDASRRDLLAAVPAAVAITGCSFVSGSESEDRPPYVVENESGEPRNVDLQVWKVGRVAPFDERPDSFREEFEAAAADGSVDDSAFEWTDGYDLTIEPGAAAKPLASSSATGLLYVQASADHGERIGVWVEAGDSPGDFFVDISVYGSGASATTGEY
ncbi:hypothetical protein C475_10759 [Halosimplex carlsbadense 2-9-1]|uniref:Uncharacterized protein n=1 Tax=Halosimplex carlsbadense 2-9-1 TaxID=797114 RepID=M0CP77_9EURY|nr:hypothetical protein [Halosimplex carlsbadense]ELZ25021.1 hypothetical protein C475_10759 [Halosimplex carlsbadense 2-9-1]